MGQARLAAITDVGCVREANQDEFFLGRAGVGLLSALSHRSPQDADGLVFGVADGMGGMPDGDLASRLAVEAIADCLASQTLLLTGGGDGGGVRERNAVLVRRLFQEAHSRIAEANRGREPQLMMGTTLTLAALSRDHAVVGNVGDSRLYLLRADEAKPLTTDQTVANFLVRYGHISADEAREHPERKVLAQAMGHGKDIEVDIEHVPLCPGDVLLACSDGLSDLVQAHELPAIAGNPQNDPQGRLERLVELAKQRGGHDNITIVALDFLA